MLKEGIYEDFERREQLLKLARFRSTSSGEGLRSLADYVATMKEGQKAIFYMAGDDRARLEASPQLEGFRARGVEVILLTEPVDSFWVMGAPEFDGRPLKSVTQGAADLTEIPLPEGETKPDEAPTSQVATFLAFVKTSLGEAVSDVTESQRLTTSAVCLVAPEHGPDRQFERLLSAAGRLDATAKPILEINPRHERIVALAKLGDKDNDGIWLAFGCRPAFELTTRHREPHHCPAAARRDALAPFLGFAAVSEHSGLTDGHWKPIRPSEPSLRSGFAAPAEA